MRNYSPTIPIAEHIASASIGADAALAPSNLAIYWEQLTQLLGRGALNLPARLRSHKDPPAQAWLLPRATNWTGLAVPFAFFPLPFFARCCRLSFAFFPFPRTKRAPPASRLASWRPHPAVRHREELHAHFLEIFLQLSEVLDSRSHGLLFTRSMHPPLVLCLGNCGVDRS